MWTDDVLSILLEGRREDWPGGPRTLASHAAGREPTGRTCWFGANLDPDGTQVWFRIDEEAISRMPEKTPRASGERLIDALVAWLTPDRQPRWAGQNRPVCPAGHTGRFWLPTEAVN